MTLSAYLPQDRLQSLVEGRALPDLTTGAALFADISGFTPLTELLTRQLGERRGIEELTRRINSIYDALIRQVELGGGSVINFAGDAITCWFDASPGNPSRRAVQVAGALQAAMQRFEGISLKVAVTTGTVRRFVVGNPQVQLLDTLAGETIARLSVAEHLAGRGEVIVDRATVEALEAELQVGEWRADSQADLPFATLALAPSTSTPLPPPAPSQLVSPEVVREWVLPTVYTREESGLGEFLTELRPAVVLFLRFTGIDYDGDKEAREKLDAFIRQGQEIVAGYDGTLLQLTIGDKGSYLYACFGAPNAHEDDDRRAVKAALELRKLAASLAYLEPVQIGISRGTLRAGAYGSATRRTYGALGDEVNVAARLMTFAQPGEILLTARVQELVREQFNLEARLPVKLKGKQEALSIFAVKEAQGHWSARLLEPVFLLPMVGRQRELGVTGEKLARAREEKGQVIGITAEAGLGKSRLVAEVIGQAQQQGFKGYGGACESSGTNSAYLVWRPIWQAFFEVDPLNPASQQLRHLENRIGKLAPDRLQAIPLVGPLLEIPLPENEFTASLDPKDRRNALEALLEECLKTAAREGPILLVLEDVHWIDPLSHDLLETLARATANSAVCIVMAYRSMELERLQASRVEALPQFTRITLDELGSPEAEQLIRAKAAQLFGEGEGGLPQALVEKLAGKGQGNPFFLEELLNYLRDRGISPYDEQAVSSLELPTSLHTLILSRIDRLSETQKATLKVASIIGRLFPFAWLHGYYPGLGTVEEVKQNLEHLSQLDITPLDSPEPELMYLFKHIVTQEVAYESLAFATRSQLHEQLGDYLERQDAERYLDLLAYHYGKSENREKQREYFLKAGDAARAAYANEAALDYYERLLPLLSNPGELADLYLNRGAVLQLLGQYDLAEKHYEEALKLAGPESERTPGVKHALGKLHYMRGNYPEALEWFEQVRVKWAAAEDRAGLGLVLVDTGLVFWRQGDYPAARKSIEDGLALKREIGDRRGIGDSLASLGIVTANQGDFAAAQGLFEESLALRREIGDKKGLTSSLNNLGNIAFGLGDNIKAGKLHREALQLWREIGDKSGVATSLNNLALVMEYQGDYVTERALLNESLALFREIGNRWGIANATSHLGGAAFNQGDYEEASLRFEESLMMGREMGDRRAVAIALNNLGNTATMQGNYSRAKTLAEESLQLRREMQDRHGIASSLNCLGRVAHGQDDYAGAEALFKEAVQLMREIEDKKGLATGLSGLGNVALSAGDLLLARTAYEESLSLRREIEDKEGTVDTLIGLAGVANKEGALEKALHLAGAANAFCARLNYRLWPLERRVYRKTLEETRAGLGEEAFKAAFEAGQKLTLEEAANLALQKRETGTATQEH